VAEYTHTRSILAPLPWTVTDNPLGSLDDIKFADGEGMSVIADGPIEDDPSIAKRIVTAVNAHGDLMATLRGFLEWNRDPCQYDHEDYCQTHGLHYRPCLVERARELMESVEHTKEESR